MLVVVVASEDFSSPVSTCDVASCLLIKISSIYNGWCISRHWPLARLYIQQSMEFIVSKDDGVALVGTSVLPVQCNCNVEEDLFDQIFTFVNVW